MYAYTETHNQDVENESDRNREETWETLLTAR